MKPILLASSNAGKIREMRTLLNAHGYIVHGQDEQGIKGAEESGRTFVENALLKARHAAAISGMASLAEDSGLCVPALQGAPGLFSARYAGPGATDAENNQRLLEQMRALTGASRAAYYIACMVFMESADDPAPIVAQGFWMGTIGKSLQGEGGFGYDPLFRPLGGARSAAEWTLAEKNQVSHRAHALRRLLAMLQERQAPQSLSESD
ncbi:RdgB/HAM1 family non-canonical purine NTP pyrophosphatase [Acidithiobacillus thiooxidans]|uniref:dITP/XTP pyrophosphatase n=1 Tax=Acidithiobacillus thiooxidans ATCC 19377 TaxID=637390 RepID=A0A543PZW6_ACITH|nr:RdgB/HAM1 family non-canonical purine NTP pyrophosphatase [Acidithiobacillus thiooxidans]MDX5936372.1 RdgB/HAM1 family non-canonical purine NTP pyrophosphatase [Acidithiobacillus thiooxidans]TQN49624.1 dITP/XTP pyrophosphatase [Acidithiobacillus thiooxidans ATCC 19377]